MSDHEKLNDNQSTFKQKHETQSPTHASGTTSESVNPAAAVQRLLGGSASHNDVIQLQRTIGNRAVTNMVQRSNAMTVTRGDDDYEKHADKKGQEIASVLASGPQRMTEEGVAQRTPNEDMQLKRIQRANAPEVGFSGGGISEELTQQIESSRGKGQPVDAGIQSAASQVLQRDFSNVSVQVNPEVTSRLGAQAATIGSDIFVSKPSDATNASLMGHELTHSGVHQNAAPAIQPKRIQRTEEDGLPPVDEGQLKRIQRNEEEGLPPVDEGQLKRIQRNVDEEGKEFE